MKKLVVFIGIFMLSATAISYDGYENNYNQQQQLQEMHKQTEIMQKQADIMQEQQRQRWIDSQQQHWRN
jgi:hypothetical protein